MTSLLPGLGTLWLAAAPVPCWSLVDDTPGWKRVVLPAEAPALAAPGDFEQFRSGEPVLLREVRLHDDVGSTHERPGRMAYTFQVAPGTTRLEVGFKESLQGAKVDATAFAGETALTLLDEVRVPGERLALEWKSETVDRVVVTVRYHLRGRPVVASWATSRRIRPERDPSLPEGFRLPRSLYFLHPGGPGAVLLCQRPGLDLRVSRPPTARTPLVTVSLPPR
ncbi:hypothetical protein LY474_18030 [Myxococcus stipitatus]|uniref:hypothetical protein n=1 Tax=Myxococcus stipitatus TaxID=83455 RepID=UPI001F1F64E1|nr:hypothetical protein [Myxococcus stipitatus]MCE9669698.1 hypothetical protein [Myxococcus stipitatus]